LCAKRANGFLQELTPEEQRAVLERLPPEERLRGLSPEEILRRFAPEERLRGLVPEERLRGLGPDELRRLQEELAISCH
jgi:hypothetical protein